MQTPLDDLDFTYTSWIPHKSQYVHPSGREFPRRLSRKERIKNGTLVHYDVKMSPTMRSVDRVIRKYGEDAVIDLFTVSMANGKRPELVCKELKLSWIGIRNWFEADPRRNGILESAKRAYADKLVWDALEEVISANEKDVQVRKLRSETFLKIAGLKDRKQYGQKVEVEVDHKISILDALNEARGRVIDITPEVVT